MSMSPEEFDRQRAAMDRATTQLTDFLPPLWKVLYEKTIKEGFTETQAFELLKTYILSQNPNGIKP